jgi:hypothetical protein
MRNGNRIRSPTVIPVGAAMSVVFEYPPICPAALLGEEDNDEELDGDEEVASPWLGGCGAAAAEFCDIVVGPGSVDRATPVPVDGMTVMDWAMFAVRLTTVEVKASGPDSVDRAMPVSVDTIMVSWLAELRVSVERAMPVSVDTIIVSNGWLEVVLLEALKIAASSVYSDEVVGNMVNVGEVSKDEDVRMSGPCAMIASFLDQVPSVVESLPHLSTIW